MHSKLLTFIKEVKEHLLKVYESKYNKDQRIGSPFERATNISNCINIRGRCPPAVMVKTMDCKIVVSEFVFQSRYYVHFRINTLGKGMNPLILPAMG